MPENPRLLVHFILVIVLSACTRESPAPEITDPIAELIRAANSGDVAAQARLGWLHEHGQAVPFSFEEAFKWYLMAAMQGDYWTIAKVGRMYFHGEGVLQDYRLAYAWTALAAEVGNEHSMILMNDIRTSLREDILTEAEKAAAHLRTLIPAAIVKEKKVGMPFRKKAASGDSRN